MKRIGISLETFKSVHKDVSKNLRIESPNIDTTLKDVASLDPSFYSEYDRLLYNHYNPPLPRVIRIVGVDGDIEYYVEADNGNTSK